MKTVRLANNVVVEIIPTYALPIDQWYPADFCAQCREAPDDVQQGYVYHPETDTYTEPEAEQEPEPTEEEDLSALVIDHEYRLTLLELGVTEDAV